MAVGTSCWSASARAAASAAIFALRERVAPTSVEARTRSASSIRPFCPGPPTYPGRVVDAAGPTRTGVAPLVAVRGAGDAVQSCAGAPATRPSGPTPTARLAGDPHPGRSRRRCGCAPGPRTARCTPRPGDRVPDWVLDSVPAMLGADDDPSGFAPQHPVLADAHRRGRTGGCAAPTWCWRPWCRRSSSRRSPARRRSPASAPLVHRFGERAPGAGAERGVWVQPSAETLRMVPSWEWLRMHIDPARSRTVVRACQVASVARADGRPAGRRGGPPAALGARHRRVDQRRGPLPGPRRRGRGQLRRLPRRQEHRLGADRHARSTTTVWPSCSSPTARTATGCSGWSSSPVSADPGTAPGWRPGGTCPPDARRGQGRAPRTVGTGTRPSRTEEVSVERGTRSASASRTGRRRSDHRPVRRAATSGARRPAGSARAAAAPARAAGPSAPRRRAPSPRAPAGRCRPRPAGGRRGRPR